MVVLQPKLLEDNNQEKYIGKGDVDDKMTWSQVCMVVPATGSRY